MGHRRTWAILGVVAALVATIAAVPSASAAGSATVTPDVAAVVEAADWSLAAPGGPWDFETPGAGFPTSPSESPPSGFDAWADAIDGSISMSQRRTLHLLYAQSGAVPSLRNAHRPVDGTRWDLLSTQIWVDRPAFLFVQSRQCDMSSTASPRPGCTTANVSSARSLSTGWNLVVDHPVSGASWNTTVEGVQLRVCPKDGGACSTDPSAALATEIAWVRLSDAPAPSLGLTVAGGSATRLGWERVPATGRAEDAGTWAASGTALTFPAGVLEPGDYRFRVDDGGGWGPWSASMTVATRPRPVVLDPDAAGETADWSSVVRGNPWDMTSTADVERLDGISSATHTAGWLRGTSDWSDPRVTLELDGATINTRRWHRLGVEVDNPGSWHITGTSGVLGRLVWWPGSAPTGATPTTGDDVILPGGEGWVHVDLATVPPARVEEQNGPGTGWSDLGEVRGLRWDPHEVDATQAFGVGHVRLARNDRVDGDEQFTVRWRDDGWRPGTTAELALVSAPGAAGGTVLATVPMAAADGSYTWTNLGPERGTHWVRVRLTTGDGHSTDAWSTGPLDVTARATFTDVADGSTFFDDIDWLVAHRLASGDPDQYRPASVTSRQAMAAFLYRLAGEPDGVSPTCAVPPFPDVATSHPFCGEIGWLASESIAEGYADGGFHPLSGISRQAMAAFLLRYAGWAGHPVPVAPTCGAAPFPDVPVTHRFCGEIEWLVAESIAQGYADGRFHPGDPITRQAMAAFVHRLDSAGLS